MDAKTIFVSIIFVLVHVYTESTKLLGILFLLRIKRVFYRVIDSVFW